MKISIRMKLYSIIMMSVLFMFISCAEEGPYKMGQMECSVKCNIVTPSSAMVSCKVPTNKDNILYDSWRLVLIDRPLNNNEILVDEIASSSEYTNIPEEFTAVFNGLTPNTTYYLLFYTEINYNGDNKSGYGFYYPGFSFTTKKEGDYSELVDYDIKLELDNYNYYDITVLKIFTTRYCCLQGYVYASNSPDFENAVRTSIDANISHSATINFYPVLEKEKYYFKFEGNIGIMFENRYVEFENVSILFPDTIDLANY